jgi:hypothetical protein
MCDEFIAANEQGKTVGTTCTQTELLLFMADAPGFGDGGVEAGTCLNCALKKSAIDDTIGTGDTALECDDLADAATAPPGFANVGAPAVQECLAVLGCEIGVLPAASPGPLFTSPLVHSTAALANAYCGLASSADCQAGNPKGACVSQIAAGLPSTYKAGAQTLSDLAPTIPVYPTGQAGVIVYHTLFYGSPRCTSCTR